jgi:hypothetical protein
MAQNRSDLHRQQGSVTAQLRIAIGFTSSGRRSRNIGECWDKQCSEDRHFEIFIRSDLTESKDLNAPENGAPARRAFRMVSSKS